MTAKISDLGVARMLNLTPLQVSHMTQTPGTPAYMPPEVMIADPRYDTSVDEFSYGIMMIHVFSGQWPEPQIGPTRNDPDTDNLIPVSEAERRNKFLQAIGNDHPLMDLILKCLNNNPRRRAHASEIVEQLAQMVARFLPTFINRVEALKGIESKEAEIISLKGEANDNNEQIVANKQWIEELQEKLSAEHLQNSALSSQITQLTEQVKKQEDTLLVIKKALDEHQFSDSGSKRQDNPKATSVDTSANNEDHIMEIERRLTPQELESRSTTPFSSVDAGSQKDMHEEVFTSMSDGKVALNNPATNAQKIDTKVNLENLSRKPVSTYVHCIFFVYRITMCSFSCSQSLLHGGEKERKSSNQSLHLQI